MQISQEMVQQIVSQVLAEMKAAPPQPSVSAVLAAEGKLTLRDKGVAQKGTNAKEVVIGVAPAFGKNLHYTIKKLPHDQILREIMAGIEEEGCTARIVRITRTGDLGHIGNRAAKLSGSGIGIGLQSKGTIVIHQKDLFPLTNLELFPLSPILTLEKYRAIGRNAAKYAKGENPTPVPVKLDETVLPLYQPIAVLLHNKEVLDIVHRGDDIELEAQFKE
ncbi:MAG TPA: propanediol/glycerol family dehydratase medium subunit [Firmicutes bacterium]|nr:propanediol/glycerol family dehydratase medium subunit [Bacillota bacterium]